MTAVQKNNIEHVISELKGDYSIMFDSDDHIGVSIDDATYIRLVRLADLNFYSSIKIPKVKAVTVEWLFERMAKMDNIKYVNYTELFEKLNQRLGLNLNSTSYGLGVDTTFDSHKTMHDRGEAKGDILTAHGIDFTMDISDASWVYRLRISKSKKNLELINSII